MLIISLIVPIITLFKLRDVCICSLEVFVIGFTEEAETFGVVTINLLILYSCLVLYIFTFGLVF